MTEKLEKRIVDAFAAPVVQADPAVLQRILNRREQGERISLEPARGSSPWTYRAVAVAIAAGLLVFVGISSKKEEAPRQQNPVGLLAEASLPQMLMAQGAERPSYPELEMSGPELKPGEWVYSVLRDGAAFSDTSPRLRSRLDRGEFKGQAVWLMLSRERSNGSTPDWLDTTWVEQDSLRLLARSTSVLSGKGRVFEEFREHDVLKGFTSAGSTSWTVIAADSSEGTASNGYVLEGDVIYMAIRRAKLSPDWRASIEVKSSPIYNRVVTRWYDLTVSGEERITVPAGEFDCWKIDLGPPSEYRKLGHISIYVSKDKQWIIKQGIEGGTQREFWIVLVSGRED